MDAFRRIKSLNDFIKGKDNRIKAIAMIRPEIGLEKKTLNDPLDISND